MSLLLRLYLPLTHPKGLTSTISFCMQSMQKKNQQSFETSENHGPAPSCYVCHQKAFFPPKQPNAKYLFSTFSCPISSTCTRPGTRVTGGARGAPGAVKQLATAPKATKATTTAAARECVMVKSSEKADPGGE